MSKDQIRITGGKYRGRTLGVPGVSHAMGARERLALFNMIGAFIPDATVLDAYAGSGALGIEALSRGAEKAFFIEKDAEAVRVIKGNLARLGADSEVRQGDVLKVLVSITEKFDVIFADPPYDEYEPEMITELTQKLKAGGFLVTSTPTEGPEITGMKKIKARKYAAAHITVYEKK